MPHNGESLAAGSCDKYLLRQSYFHDLDGRLLINWGSGSRAWIQRADNQNKQILGLRERILDPPFPGFSKFVSSLSILDSLPRDWQTILSASKGVYLLTCPRTKEQYVGSATGAGGFFARWNDYFSSGHGGNLGLKSREPSDYQISILEVAGSLMTADEILELEALWKLKLQSREMGLNRN